MKQRVITAVFFAAAMLGGVFGGFYSFCILFAIITAGCLWELTGMLFQAEAHQTFRRVTGVTIGMLAYLPMTAKVAFPEWEWLLDPLFGSVLFISYILIAVELFFASSQPFSNIGRHLVCFIYVGLPFALLAQMSVIHAGYDQIYSPWRVFGLLLLIWTNDTMAYFIGSQFGKRKLFERISPKKTWEGTIGGGICTVLIAWGLSFLIHDFTPVQWIALGAVAAIFGTLGDLVESMLKRSVGVKDSGNLLPGHGGLLDRFDAFIFALPFYWLALMFL